MHKNKSLGQITSIEPEDFRNSTPSAALNKDLETAKNIDVFFKEHKKHMIPRNLPMHLEMLLKKKRLKKADVARDSELNRQYVYQIFDGTKTPSRDKLIAIAFGLHLSDKETQTMLKLSGNRELYVRDRRDAVILFSLQRNMDIHKTNDLLYNHGFTLLGNFDD